MLAGLLFATHDAVDRPQSLAATLPLGVTTLIEFQARQLIEVGASQLIVVVSRLTPELLGAVNRIGQRGASVDVVRNAAEAMTKLHPLAHVLMLADGLVTSAATLGSLADADGDTIVTVPEATPGSFERLGGGLAWAGVARIDPRRLDEAARLPRDYDLQSALLRVAAQAGATQVALPASALAAGHGIEHRADGIAERGRTMIAALVEGGTSWFDRWIVGPIARRALPALVDRGVPAPAVGAVAAAVALIGLGALGYGHAAIGLAAVTIAGILVALAETLARLHDQDRLARMMRLALDLTIALAVLLLGRAIDAVSGAASGLVAAVALVAIGALAERATVPANARRWWATPPAYPLIALPFALAGMAFAGVAAAAVYATATLAAAIEAWRQA